MEQITVVVLLVVLAAVYSAWYLLPAAMRPRLGRLHRWFARTSACGSCQDCRGCSAMPQADAGQNGVQPIRFQPRR